MSTSDVPTELKGALGQVGSSGGGIAPLLAPAPVPNAAQGSPGLATATAAPAPAPRGAHPDDPVAMSQMIAQLANQLFGTSLAPVPLSPVNATTAVASTAPPSSPGVAALMPSTAGAPTASPSIAAQPQTTDGWGAPPSSPAPFAGSPSFDPLPLLGAAHPGGVPGMDVGGADFFRMPVVTAPAIDAPPSYLPDAGALGLDSAPATAPRLEAYEIAPASPLVRDLGGNAFDPYLVRKDFPILEERVHGKRLVWLDNAATTHKPAAVIDRISYFYRHENSNIHRAAHTLAARATDAYEKARESVRRFINAPSDEDIIFVRGATEGINLIAQSWGRRNIGAGDEIVLTHLEHHANIVPWQQLCAEKGAKLRIAPVDDRGDVIVEEYEKLLNPRTRLVSFTQVSNALGTITPAKQMIEIARRHGATVLLDGAQAVSHMKVDVQDLDCDFYAFSGHKVFAPTGIGAVYGKKEVLAAMPPWQGGGNMIQDVTFERTTYQAPPWRFEAGTGSIADAVGLGEALDYVTRIGIDNIDRYEHELLVYATERLATVPGLTMIGTAPRKAGVLSFVLDGQRTEDVGAMLDKEGIAVRSGHHCAQPILRRYGLEASVRASLAFYNICEDIDALVDALRRIQVGRG